MNGQEWNTDSAVRALHGEIGRAAARLQKRRHDRMQALIFLAALLALALVFACAMQMKRPWLWPACGMALTALLAPALAYHKEEEESHEA